MILGFGSFLCGCFGILFHLSGIVFGMNLRRSVVRLFKYAYSEI